jgi:fused signal recognition particle receptor
MNPSSKLSAGLRKTRSRVFDRLKSILSGGRLEKGQIDELEGLLLEGDVGVSATEKLIATVQRSRTDLSPVDALKQAIVGLLSLPPMSPAEPAAGPFSVWLFVGVNGTGKTTTIAKLAKRFKDEGKKVLLCACDTYRAAGSEQLEIWAKRVGVDVVASQTGADAAAVAFDGMQAALGRGSELLLIDTAGRLHTRKDLMEELSKIKRVVEKRMPNAPHETILVMDATLGQNGLQQAKVFNERMKLTGIVLCKVDGTAKGGIVIAIADELKVPVRYIGVGEGMDDLLDFDPEAFAAALLTDN